MSLTKVFPRMIEGVAISVKDFGAVGDGVTDDTAAIQAALDAASPLKKLVKIPDDLSCRFTANLTIPTNTGFCGTGELLADYTNLFGEIVVSTTGGSDGSPTLMTVDTSASSQTITVADVTGISAGGYILVGSNKYNGRYPQQVLKVVSVDTGTNVITLAAACGVEYLVSDGGYVKPLTMISDVTIKDVTFRCSSASNFGEFINASYVVNLLIDNVKIINHKSQEGVGGGITNSAAGGIGASYCFNATLQNNVLQGSDTFSPGAAAVAAFYTQKALVQGNKSNNYAFGFGLYNLYEGVLSNNIGVGIAVSGNRALKISSSLNCVVDSNIVSYFDSGFKIEDASNCVCSNNILSNLGVSGSGGIAISVSTNQAITSAFNNIFDSNVIENVVIGAFTDVYSSRTIFSNNTIKNCSDRAMIMSTPCKIVGNTIQGFSTYGIGFPQLSVIANNIIFTSNSATPSMRPIGSFQRSNVTSIVGNVAYNNPLDTGYDAQFGFCSFAGNNIKGQSATVIGTDDPSSGTWVVGDTVFNTNPAGTAPYAWLCTGAGSPGSWRPIGGETRSVAPAQFDKTNTSLSYVTGLGASPRAGYTYNFKIGLFIDADATGGYKVAVGGSSTTVSSLTYQVRAFRNDTNALAICSRLTSWSTGSGGVGAAGGTEIFVEIVGSFVCTGSGNFTALFAQNVGNGTSSVLPNSYLELTVVS